ncbi:MAG: N4-gp56 family major capsid protein [Nitrospiria bacterium]
MANAYTASTDLNTIPKYYSKVFLERLQPGPIMMDYCMQIPLPVGTGTTLYFPRLAVSSTTPSAYKLTQGTIISTEKVVDVQISAVLEQFGNAKAFTDIAQLTAINTTIEENIKEIGDQANNIVDKRIRDEAYGTSSIPWGGGFSVTAFDNASSTDLGASTSAYFTYVGTAEFQTKASTLRYLAKKMKGRNVRPFDDGFYVLVCHSDVAMQIQADNTWQSAYQYTDPENMRRGVVGAYGGVKVQVDNNILTSAMGSAGATLYFNILLGQGALATSMLDGGVKTYTVGAGADKFDPIDQFISFGWKINFVPQILNVSSGLVYVSADQ